MVDETTHWSIGAILTACAAGIAWALRVERRLGKLNGGTMTRMQDELDGHTRALSKDRAGIAALQEVVKHNTVSIDRMEEAVASQNGTLQEILTEVKK